MHTDCQGRGSQDQCFGVLGCSWCHAAQDGTPLAATFCARQETCYSGVLASPSPYALLTDRTQVLPRAWDDGVALFRALPIGPVVGGIMAFFLLLAVTAWGYRHWSVGERRLLSSSGSSLRISQLEEEPEQEQPPPAGHHNYGLHGDPGGAPQAVVSSYRMNPGYRRPRPASTDSDPGYSTITPFGDQDSEIMSCLGEPVRRLQGVARGEIGHQGAAAAAAAGGGCGGSHGATSPACGRSHGATSPDSGGCPGALSASYFLLFVQYFVFIFIPTTLMCCFLISYFDNKMLKLHSVCLPLFGRP